MKAQSEKLRNTVMIAALGAMAAIIMYFEFPLPFIAPSFYELDLSEIPVLVGTFMMGPAAGVLIELVKVLIKLVIKGTTTGYVGDFANFCIGCALVVPAGMIYKHKKTKKNAMAAMAVGTIVMAVAAVFLNVYVMLPFFSHMMPIEQIIAMGAEINPAISNIWTFAIIAVAPFNLVKGVIVSIVTLLIYKRISVLLRGH